MVEIKDTPKIVIAKPVACRPSLSGLKSYSDLIAGTVNTSPTPAVICDTAAAVIRPRTLRFRPVSNVDLSGDEVYLSEKVVPETVIESNVLYKPVAKLVSKRTVSLLANLGDGRAFIPRQDVSDTGTPVQPSNLDKPGTEQPSDFHPNFCPAVSVIANAALENDAKFSLLPHTGDRSSYDGHNWRKYGQKHVKGSEYLRSYYKCTQPNCPVKKKIQKTLDGQIAEIVYSGEHNHSKPQLITPNENATHNDLNHTWTSQKILGSSPDAGLPVDDPLVAAACNASVSTSNNSLSRSGFEEVSDSFEIEDDRIKTKRKRFENQLVKASVMGEASYEAPTVVQNTKDSDAAGDGFRWRKYGQKVVKGNPYPRSYYRCTSTKCNARKYVEKTSEDPDSVITTYEGKHNHDVPIKSTYSDALKKTGKDKA